MKLFPLSLECHYLFMVELVAAEYLVIEPFSFFTFVARNVFDELMSG